jgi:hypothetical protein
MKYYPHKSVLLRMAAHGRFRASYQNSNNIRDKAAILRRLLASTGDANTLIYKENTKTIIRKPNLANDREIPLTATKGKHSSLPSDRQT